MSAALADLIGARGADERLLVTPDTTLRVGEATGLGHGPTLGPADTVALSIGDRRSLIRTLAALDGEVAGLLLVSTAQTPEVTATLALEAGCAAIVSDRDDLQGALSPEAAVQEGRRGDGAAPTAWIMTTSGTTGIPKMVPHTLASLARTVRRDPSKGAPVWGMLYEMTRFAGLQVALQALIGGGTLAAPPMEASLADQVAFLAQAGCTHLSATPTLWRRLMMVPGIEALPLRQVTMGGEIADQAVLDAVGRRFPEARLTHIYASTEAGVGFAVNDRQAGFPVDFTDRAPGGVGVAIRDGMLWLRPPGGRRVHYLGGQAIETDAEGFVATGDRIETRGARAHFLGRDSGVVNVGGVKVYPERVERLIAGIDGVGLVQVAARKNPITGALLVATVVPADAGADREALKAEIQTRCRAELEREAVPARIAFADALATNAAGKILRS